MRYNKRVMNALPLLFKALGSLPPTAAMAQSAGEAVGDAGPAGAPSWIEALLPDDLAAALSDSLLGVAYWQWAGLFLVIVVGLALELVVRLTTRGVMRRSVGRRLSEDRREEVLRAGRPIGWFAAAALWLGAVEVNLLLFDAEGLVYVILLGSARVFAVLAGTWAAWRVVDFFAELLTARAARTDNKFDDVLVPLVRKALKVFIVIFGVIYGAQSLNIPIGPMLASLGVGSLAFAFAARDTIENFFGSVAVLLDRPFSVGDWVVTADTEGIVEEIGFRSTRVRTFYNSLVTVPNANLVRATVDNYGRRRYRRWSTTLGLQYDTPPDKLVAFAEGVRELARTHPYTRKDFFAVYLNEFGPSSLNIMLYVFFEVPDWSTELRERERLALDIVRLADRLGVSFAFPTQTVHLHRASRGATGDEPSRRPPAPGADQAAARQGARAAHELIAAQPWRRERPGPVVFDAGPSFIPIDPETGQPTDPQARRDADERAGGG